MRYTAIPHTSLQPACICLGAALLGSSISRDDSFDLLDTYVEAGGNFLDTAHVYANWLPGERSASEKTIGRWLRERRNRSQIIVATKGGHPDMDHGMTPRLMPEQLRTDLDESLTFLSIDCIDLYWLHRDDLRRPVAEMLETLNDQRRAGKIRHFGCSNWSVARIAEAQNYARRHDLEGFVANQLMWSLAEPVPEQLADKTLVLMDDDTHAFHQETSLPALAFSSQAQGFFHKMHQGQTAFSESTWQLYGTETNIARFQKTCELARALNTSTTAVALSYLTSQPFPTIPIVGCRTRGQLTDTLQAADLTLPPAALAYLQDNQTPPSQIPSI